jgi:hypothetical protein
MGRQSLPRDRNCHGNGNCGPSASRRCTRMNADGDSAGSETPSRNEPGL